VILATPSLGRLHELTDARGLPAVIRSEASQRLMKMVTRVAKTGAAVLIQGETGSGKELIARAVHQFSSRSQQPWVEINCAALPEHLVESELFGHERGAFSGADEMKPGLIELARGGTLFLDEIGELEPRMQVKLLRVLDGSAYYRLGGTKRIAVDVRIVAATNRNLTEAIERGTFRRDLYYRISQVQLAVPALRERPEDVEGIAQQLLAACRPDAEFDTAALQVLRSYSWPGNIRELQSVIIRANLALDPELNIIRPFHLPAEVHLATKVDDNEESPTGDLDSMERLMIERALKESAGDHRTAAHQLGISRRTLSRKIKAYNLGGILGPPAGSLGALGPEQSRYFRGAIYRPVVLRSVRGYAEDVESVNLSRSGIGVCGVKKPLEFTGIIDVQFDLDEPQTAMAVKGSMSWTDAQGNAGIRFASMSRSFQQSLDDWVTRKRIEEGWASS
jgi:DNA-binding NtrC family response regulator